jgi:hypothetical protein
VLKNVDTALLTRAEALQRYHSYATEQLAFAGDHSPLASSALYGLGRAESIATAGAGVRNPLGGPNAMALFQAALIVNPQNYMASNELGVLLARYGDLDAAEIQLVHSISIKPQVETWHNLAAVYRRQGEVEKADQAEGEREKLIAAARTGSSAKEDPADLGTRPVLRWVEPEVFAVTGRPDGLDGPPIRSSNSASTAARGSLGKRLISRLMPWQKTNKSAATESVTQLSQKTDPANTRAADREQFVR